jgi:ubiquinone/menaquinone biosynthesis C-methylase UbiE
MTMNNKETASRFFDSVADSYLGENYLSLAGKYPTLMIRHLRILNLIPEETGTVLDAGCGSGALLHDLTLNGHRAIGFDISPQMIQAARGDNVLSPRKRCDMLLNDLEQMPLRDGSVDVFTAAGVIEYLPRDSQALSEVSRILKPGGVAIITLTNATTPLWLAETILKKLGVWGAIYTRLKRGESFPEARVHVPNRFSWLASLQGLKEVHREYFHFTPLPFPLDNVFKEPSIKKGLEMERLSKTRWGFLGRGCILKYVKAA